MEDAVYKPEDEDILPANTREEQITATGQGAKGDEGSLEIVRARSGVASQMCVC